MRHNILPIKLCVCPTCGFKDLSYYKEDGKGHDLYYCTKCYKIAEWNGRTLTKTKGEAYPDREKPEEEKEHTHEWKNGVCMACGEIYEPDDFSGATPGDR